MYQACYPLGPAFANYQLLCCKLQTDLSAELALRSQYQCCFHKITKSVNYSITLHIKMSNLIFSGIFYKYEPFIVVQCMESKRL